MGDALHPGPAPFATPFLNYGLGGSSVRCFDYRSTAIFSIGGLLIAHFCAGPTAKQVDRIDDYWGMSTLVFLYNSQEKQIQKIKKTG